MVYLVNHISKRESMFKSWQIKFCKCVFFTNKILFETISHLSCFLVLVIALSAITPCHTDHPRVIEPWQLRRTTTSRAFGFQEGFPQLYEQFPHYTSLVGDTLYTNSNVLCTPTRYIVSSSW